jgi:transcriptional regulator with AAA-type ATPase domain
MNRLVVFLGSLPVLAFEVTKDRLRLGRGRENDIVLPLPDVADRHAVISRSGGRVVIHATDGEHVFREGRPVREADLSGGGTVGVGGYRLRWIAGGDGFEPEGIRPGIPADAGIVRVSTAEEPVPASPPAGPFAAPMGPLLLQVAAGPDRGLQILLDGPAVVVGRAPDSDLVLHDPTVSWRHLSVEPAGDGMRVRDLQSRNGTCVDGRRVEVGIAQPGSVVRAGRTSLRLGRAAGGSFGTGEEPGLAEMVGGSAPMRTLYARLREAAASRSPVLLLGETGTGKELAGRAIHSLGTRARGPFVPLNCAAAPRELIEDLLFGHGRGAYTGASGERRGAFERADGGTIFLDEISEVPLDLQPKLLRVLEDGAVPRLGGDERASDFRVVAASNRDLPAEAAAGRFRPDLYYRLAVLEIRLPPLCERLDDLPDLVHSFLAQAEEQTGVPGAGATRIDEDALEPLRHHPWPGNVRELRNVVLRAVVRCPGGVVDRALAEAILAETRRARPAVPRSLEETEAEAIRNALRACGGQRRAAARRLGIAESTLYEKIRRHDLTEEGPARARPGDDDA